MRKVSFIVLLSIYTWIYLGNWSMTFSSTKNNVRETSLIPTPTIKLSKSEIPNKLIIPSIGLETDIFPVGLTPERIVDTPPSDVGWYIGGVKPGEIGNANLNGHVTGIFKDLHNLKVGDDIFTVDGLGQKFHFKVIESELVDIAAFSIQKVYGAIDKIRLNLVTCAGLYDSAKKDFAQRTIIYSELAN